jgi:hypothetical protein
MQAKITQDLNGSITKFVQKDIFQNLPIVIDFLKNQQNTFYRYDPDNESLASKSLPWIVQRRKNAIIKLNIKCEAPLDEDSDLDSISEDDIYQDEKEKKMNDQLAEKEAWKAILNAGNNDSVETYEQLLNVILQKESNDVKKAIAAKCEIGYKTLRLNGSNPILGQQKDIQEEEVKRSPKREENTLQDLPQESPYKDSMNTILGKRKKPEQDQEKQGSDNQKNDNQGKEETPYTSKQRSMGLPPR